MKAVILCGGLGSRLAEETHRIPKPMVKIGNEPILSHIMRIFQPYGVNEFIIAAGYKKEVLKNYYENNSSFKNVNIIDTGDTTLTGGRLLRLKDILAKEKFFFMTYGDGLIDINLDNLLEFIASFIIIWIDIIEEQVEIHDC